MSRRLRLAAAATLLAVGLIGVGLGGGALVQTWYTAWAYSHSPDAEQAERALAQLDTHPAWDAASASPVPASRQTDATGEAEAAPSRSYAPALSLAGAPTPDPAREPPPTPSPAPRASPADLAITTSELHFEDPPAPGARAKLAVGLRNGSSLPSGELSLALPNRWFDGFEVVGAAPTVLDDRQTPDGVRHLDFPGLAAGQELTLEIDLRETGEDVDPPTVDVSLLSGEAIGQALPQASGPPPRPGPARALAIPRLAIKAAVVPTVWEPPPFVVGQIRGSANLSEGNTVLIGHLTGLAGNIFARLEQVELGDEVVAVSRGVEYRFVVSETLVLPNDDSSPALPTSTPRLTLMTCTGVWNPFTRDYSERFWVVAEPPELAQATMAANARRAVEATATAAPATPTPDARPNPSARPTRPAAPASAATPQSTAAESGDAPLPAAAGLKILSPTDGARVPARIAVKGSRAQPFDPSLHAWLFVRPEVDGGHWYVYPREIIGKPDGSWEASLDLGGAPGIRQEIVVGVATSRAQAALLQQVAQHPGQPLADLPPDFREETRVTVTRR